MGREKYHKYLNICKIKFTSNLCATLLDYRSSRYFFFFLTLQYCIVLPNIEMNPPQVYMCSPSWTLLPPHTIPLGHASAFTSKLYMCASTSMLTLIFTHICTCILFLYKWNLTVIIADCFSFASQYIVKKYSISHF